MTDKNTRAYAKRKALAVSELAGATVLDAVLVTIAPDGHYVIFMHGEKPLHLVDRVVEPSSGGSRSESIKDDVSGPGESPKRPKKVSVPHALSGTGNPGMARAQWEIIVSQMAAGKVSDDDFPGAVSRAFTVIAEEVDEEIDKDKAVKQLTAMRDALIEQHGEQWRHHLPEWPEEW